jgi:flagellar hook-associated protein 3 FlgL
MATSGLGDAARLFASTRHAGDLKARLAQLSQELSTGHAADPVAATGGDTRGLRDLERGLSMATGWGRAAAEAGHRLAAMQDALGAAEATRSGLAGALMPPTATFSAATIKGASAAGAAALSDLARTLNTGFGGTGLFGGSRTDGAAIATGEAMLGSLRAAVAGAATVAEVAARVATWFDDPAGGFATTAYLGSDADATRPLDEGQAVTLAARADAPALRAVMKAAALAALAADPALALPDTEAQALLVQARDGALTAGDGLTALRAGIGRAEAQAKEAVDRHAARASAWESARARLTEADPYATATRLQAVEAQIETHYEVTARLASLSLARVLR